MAKVGSPKPIRESRKERESKMSGRTHIEASGAPEAVGPYSHAVRHGSVLYCSGALPIDPQSGEMVLDSPAAETDRCLRNLAAICEAVETDLSHTITVGVSHLPKGVRVEIDAIVAVG